MMDAFAWAATSLLLLGALFMAIAALGMLRMPDLFMRMQTSSKASALGAMLMLLGAALHFRSLEVTMRAMATIAFIFFTVPVGAHILARTAYLIGDRFAPGTQLVGIEKDDDAAEPATGVDEKNPDA